MKFQSLTSFREIHAYLLMKGKLSQYNCSLSVNHFVIRQRVESLILSSQISTDLQRRVFLDGETVQLTFNIGVV